MKLYLLECANACNIIFAKKLAKAKYFYRFAKHTRKKPRNNDLRKPNCKTLQKVYFLLAPSTPLLPMLRQGQPKACLLSMVILNVLRLFIITIPKPIISAAVLSFVCPKCFTMYANQAMMEKKKSVTLLFQVHGILCNLLDFSCSHIFFCFKLLSRLSCNNRTSASLIPLSLNVFY